MSYQEITFEKDSIFLVTGGAGFIGSNLCEALVGMGYTVRCLDDLSTGKYENIEPLEKSDRFTFIKGDIRDLDTCMEACKDVDYVLNQAAWGFFPVVTGLTAIALFISIACLPPVSADVPVVIPVFPSPAVLRVFTVHTGSGAVIVVFSAHGGSFSVIVLLPAVIRHISLYIAAHIFCWLGLLIGEYVV